MKVLFVSWETYPVKTATSNCLMMIISELKKYSIESGILNITGDYNLQEIQSYNDVRFYNVYVPQLSSVKSLLKKDFILGMRVASKKIIQRVINKSIERDINYKVVKMIINKLMKFGSDYDIIVGVCSHVMNAIICNDYCARTEKKFIIYQVDPIGTNIAYKNRAVMEKIELELYSKASYIITTPIIANEKRQNVDYFEIINKVFSAEFPNVTDRTSNGEITNNGNSVICFYGGRFYNGVRDCHYALEVLRRLKNENIHLVIAGDGQEQELNEYKQNFFGSRLTHLGLISLSESFNQMQMADFLINIGNDVTNQVPSKLFDYISTGKPIINFCKAKSCPTIPYLRKYKLGISLVEGEDPIEQQANQVTEFIEKNIHIRLNFFDIKNLFEANTPEYVGKLFCTLLEKTIKGKRLNSFSSCGVSINEKNSRYYS